MADTQITVVVNQGVETEVDIQKTVVDTLIIEADTLTTEVAVIQEVETEEVTPVEIIIVLRTAIVIITEITVADMTIVVHRMVADNKEGSMTDHLPELKELSSR